MIFVIAVKDSVVYMYVV